MGRAAATRRRQSQEEAHDARCGRLDQHVLLGRCGSSSRSLWIVLVIAGTWKTFVKADKPGWGAIIPFYNTYLMIKVAGRPGWWLILFFIPIVNIIDLA